MKAYVEYETKLLRCLARQDVHTSIYGHHNDNDTVQQPGVYGVCNMLCTKYPLSQTEVKLDALSSELHHWR